MTSIQVAFNQLGVNGSTDPTDFQRTVSNFPLVILRQLCNKIFLAARQRQVPILRDFIGTICEGDMVLVLGRPGSGCSTLLKTLSGRLHGLTLANQSRLNYRGRSVNQISSYFRNEYSYLAEEDIHFPSLNVSQTLDITARGRGGNGNENNLQSAEIIETLGLSGSLTTKVGDHLNPGISGGEKKRLSIAEVLECGPRVQCWDNSTRGLDSSNARRFVFSIKAATKQQRTSSVVSLYQASEELYECFNKVMLLYEGREIFYGPTSEAKSYFTKMGFLCNERTATPDFLTSITNPSLRVFDARHHGYIPQTPDEFAEFWQKSELHRELLTQFRRYEEAFPLQTSHQMTWRSSRKPYSIPWWSQVSICCRRGILRLRNDLDPAISNIIGNCILGIILGTVFLDLQDDTDSFFSRAAVIFFATLLNGFMSAFEVGTLWEQRQVVEKQYKYALFRPFTDAIAAMICDLPNKILTSFFFNLPLYLLCNLRRTASAFFTFWLFLFTCLIAMSMIFRTVGSTSSTLAGSMAPTAIFMLLLMIYAGFALPIPSMPVWLRWFNYINPLGYTFESLMINEFHGREFLCSHLLPSGPLYDDVSLQNRVCDIAGAVPGSSVVVGDTYLESTYTFAVDHKWRNFGILIAIAVFACITHLISTEYLTISKSRGEVLLFQKGSGRHRSNTDKKPSASDRGNLNIIPGDRRTYSSSIVRKSGPVTLPSLVFEELAFQVSTGEGSRQLLVDISGWIAPGSLTALMGVSGAGKTTLLNVLAKRNSQGSVEGRMMVRGNEILASSAARFGFAQQEDVHLHTATVREALQFSAILRQPSRFSRQEKLDYVDEVIEMLDMEQFADAIVGVPGQGLNSEQRRRLTVGIELAARPEALIFLDEPTSGLDSDTAWAICTLLRKLADRGQSILCTIHQPNTQIFEMFDKLLLLNSGGNQAYFGDLGEKSGSMIKYFQDRGARPCESWENPADWLMQTISTDHQLAEVGEKDSADWALLWTRSAERAAIETAIKSYLPGLVDVTTHHGGRPMASFAIQFGSTTLRLFRHHWRTPSYVYSKFGLSVLTAVAVGVSFWQSPNTAQGLQNAIFSVFLLLTCFSNIDQQIVYQYIEQRQIYEAREARSLYYSWSVFILSSLAVELIWQLTLGAVMFVAWYFPLGFFKHGAGADWLLCLLTLLSFMSFTVTGTFAVVAGFDSGAVAINIAQLLYSLSLVFCGVLVAPNKLPTFWHFMWRVSPVTYFVAALISGGLGRQRLMCSQRELLRFPPPTGQTCAQYLAPFLEYAGGYLANETESSCAYCQYTDTNQVLEAIEIDYDWRWRAFSVTIAYSFFNVIAAMAIYWLVRVPKRRKA